jgi:hypothetical protein
VRADAEVVSAPDAPVGLVDVLPADSKLPWLLKWVPDLRLKKAAVEAAAYANQIVVKGKGPEAVAKLDVALAGVRATIANIEAGFDEPTKVANGLHKHLTGLRAEFIGVAKPTLDAKGRELYDERSRLEALAREQQRRDQEAANLKARQEAEARAKAAEAQQAPAAVVEQLREEAKTATAPPVPLSPAVAPPASAHSTSVKTWKCRPIGTLDEADPHPDVKDLTGPQREKALETLRAIVEGKAPLAIVKGFDWAYLDKRAAAETTALTIPGLEAFEVGGTRAKGGRRK